MACTTLLVGKNASYDGSTMIARNDDSGSGHFTAKKFVVVQPEEHPAVYKSVISHVEVPLPGNALRMTAMPNAVEGKGIWAASGVNAAHVKLKCYRLFHFFSTENCFHPASPSPTANAIAWSFVSEIDTSIFVIPRSSAVFAAPS